MAATQAHIAAWSADDHVDAAIYFMANAESPQPVDLQQRATDAVLAVAHATVADLLDRQSHG